MLPIVRRPILAVLIVILVSQWLIGGLVPRYRISSNSMAETLFGPHCKATCPHCGHRFVCDATYARPGRYLVCPICGAGDVVLDASGVLPGDAIWVDRASLAARPIRRWEVVAARAHDDPERLIVKRVVGLPGETIAFKDGDLLVDGRRVPRTPARQYAMAQPVFDLAWFDKPGMERYLERSMDISDCKQWAFDRERTALSYRGNAADCSPKLMDWITWRHRPTAPGVAEPGPADPSSLPGIPVGDRGAFHQTSGTPVTPLQSVGDLAVETRISWREQPDVEGQFAMRLTRGDCYIEVLFEPAVQRITVTSNAPNFLPAEAYLIEGENGGSASFWGSASRQRTFFLSMFDRRCTLVVDGQEVLQCECELRHNSQVSANQEIAIGARGGEWEVETFRVMRDVHYAVPRASGKPWRLGEDEYFLVGDNAAFSIDSRNWSPQAGVPRERIVGRPISLGALSKKLF